MSLYNTILYSIVLLLLSGVGVLCVVKGLKNKSHKNLFFFIITNILFILSIYAGYEFLNPKAPEITIFFFRLTFVLALFMSFFLCTFAYHYPKETKIISPWKRHAFLALTIVMAILSISTDWFYKSVIIENGVIVGDMHGKFHGIYLAHYFFNSIVAIIISFQKNFHLLGVEKIKNILAFLGIFIVLMGTILFYTILPKFNIYLLQEEGVFFSAFFLLFVSYSILKYRFLDIRLTITRFSKNFVAILLTLGCVYGMVKLFFLSPFIQYFEYVIPLFLIGALYVHKYVSIMVIPYLFHRFFGFTSIEFFEESMKKFFTKSYVYAGVDDLKDDIAQFLKTQRMQYITLFVWKEKTQQKHAAFRDYFLQYPEVIIRDEYPFLPQERKNIPLERPSEIQTFGEVCFPLFRSQDVLLGFLVLGKKVFEDCYTVQEIEVLERLKVFIELRLTGILYRDYLHREIAKKTEILMLKNKEIQKSYTQLQSLDEAKDTFLSIASHELRTPMTVIKGFVDLLLADSDQNLKEQQKFFLSTISQNIDDLTMLVNKILDISSLEADKMEFVWEQVPFPKILQNIVNEFRVLCQEKNIRVVFENPEKIEISLRTDSFKLKQIMGNLLGNALKFTPLEGTITVRLNSGRKPKSVSISVIDTGIGVPKHEQERIFDKFYRTKHSAQITCLGTGLGLNIVRLLLQKLGGTISVTSEKNKGACFTFFLPNKEQ
jgi:signal transduction histidine kinase